jgi:hypothetical protein
MLSSQTSLPSDPHRHFSTLPLPSVDSVPGVYPDRVGALKSPFARLTHAPLASGLCKSPHQYHSMGLTFPLFSYSYALFCTMQSNNSFSLNSFRTLCPKHRGRGWSRVSVTSLSLRHAQQRPQPLSAHAFISRFSGYPGRGAPVSIQQPPSSSEGASLPRYFVTSLPRCFASLLFPWNKCLSRTSSQVQR